MSERKFIVGGKGSLSVEVGGTSNDYDNTTIRIVDLHNELHDGWPHATLDRAGIRELISELVRRL